MALQQEKPSILIINDDGIHAKGLKDLFNCAHKLANTTIVAPDSEQSSKSMAMTLTSPLTIQDADWHHDIPCYKLSGTPVDCVKFALAHFYQNKKPDLILSGINHGNNSGNSLLFSGTVGGVITGTLNNIPGIAFSHWDQDAQDFSHLYPYILSILGYFLNNPTKPGSFLNVTFPPAKLQTIKGIKLTSQGISDWTATLKPSENHSETRKEFLFDTSFITHHEKEDTDVYWLKQGYITVTPIKVCDLTDLEFLDSHKSSAELFFADVSQ